MSKILSKPVSINSLGTKRTGQVSLVSVSEPALEGYGIGLVGIALEGGAGAALAASWAARADFAAFNILKDSSGFGPEHILGGMKLSSVESGSYLIDGVPQCPKDSIDDGKARRATTGPILVGERNSFLNQFIIWVAFQLVGTLVKPLGLHTGGQER